MAQYTSTREGFQLAMELSLKGTPEDARGFFDGFCVSTFYHMFNGEKLDSDEYVSGLSMWRSRISDYHPSVQEFLRDGDHLAARMDGAIRLDGASTYFESFMFAKVDEESGRLKYLIERAVWGTPGEAPSHGATM